MNKARAGLLWTVDSWLLQVLTKSRCTLSFCKQILLDNNLHHFAYWLVSCSSSKIYIFYCSTSGTSRGCNSALDTSPWPCTSTLKMEAAEPYEMLFYLPHHYTVSDMSHKFRFHNNAFNQLV